ncbi:SipW-dependent-type signal peptide-containing protein [Halalkalirubrum salinum]|uniref:SipW-dependent-type signal peptide-containing protein n=1 Tax=Halalkalirubrum salinum TaxID=2563889 RepID=UPI001F0DC057|nr:SipW-dependent-type signal peptide-containing protein [Halalkalirubrum salinum]
MTNGNTFGLSRRKLLGGLGAIGVASAGAGLGTSAYFSDEESFENNTLTAGELDLKVDWTEHYYDGSDDETDGVDISTDPDSGYIGFPSAASDEEKTIYVDDSAQFMANTAIEAFPEFDPEEAPEEIEADDYDGQQVFLDDSICELPADLDDALSHPYRTGAGVDGGVTLGDGPNPQTTVAGDPLINISDVKPGDFGEATLSFHLCGNPGYVWLTGALEDASENGVTEPEGESENEQEDVVELLDEIHAAVWYDTGADGAYGADPDDKDSGEGDNVLGAGEFVLASGSLRSVLSVLENEMLMLDPEPMSASKIQEADEGVEDNGDTNVVESLDGDNYTLYVTTDDEEFTDSDISGAGGPRNYDCGHYESIFGIDLVGSAVEAGNLESETTYSGCTNFTVTDFNQENGEITLSTAGPVRVVSVKGGNKGENVYLFDEPVILDTVTFSTPTGQEISNIDVCCPVGDGENGDNGDNGDNGEIPPVENGDRCFLNSTTAYIGFEWWVPTDVGNEIQTDSVMFDLSFYTEQCRHNDNPDPRDMEADN